MRTTVRLDDDLLTAAKAQAASQGTTLTAVIEEALRERLARAESGGETAPVNLPTFVGDGLQPGIDLDDSAALLDLMESGGMILPDVNVLVYAHREDTREHEGSLAWLSKALSSDRAYAYSELVLSGFVRVVTHPRVFRTPTALGQALDFAATVRERANAVQVAPGQRHWGIFTRLCEQAGARGNLVPDAYLAAMAIESGCELVSTDRDFARFPGLRWSVPSGDT